MLAHRTAKTFNRNVQALKRALEDSHSRSDYYHGNDRKILQSFLRDHGFRSTEGRLNLLSVFKTAKHPLTADELTVRCDGSLNRVNVYRAIQAFCDSGMVRLVELHRGSAERYELNTDHHHHIVCTGCGDMKKFDICQADRLTRAALKQAGGFARVNSHSFELFGTCNSCAKVMA